MNNLLDYASEIEEKLGYRFEDRRLLLLAFTHRSYVNEHREVTEHNERLEFLGDSVLGVLITEYLYLSLPGVPEGDLSSLRAKIVNAPTCMAYVQKLDVEKFLLLGKGERFNEGRGRVSILADLFEAILGAIFLDGGLSASKSFIINNFGNELEIALKGPMQNAKAILQDLCQKKLQQIPLYKVITESGPDHSKHFEIEVSVGGSQIGSGQGTSKKQAQEAAAQDALNRGIWQ
jgi:ribonuclease-3